MSVKNELRLNKLNQCWMFNLKTIDTLTIKPNGMAQSGFVSSTPKRSLLVCAGCVCAHSIVFGKFLAL